MEMNLTCYHGSICREEAEQILTKWNTTGTFLIRNSETMPGCFTLCLWADDGFHQYRIINDGDGVYIKAEVGVEETKYPNLLKLIDYYRSRDMANGLAAPLKIPVTPDSNINGVYDLKKESGSDSIEFQGCLGQEKLCGAQTNSQNKRTEAKQLLVCYFQHKFKYERHNKFNAIFYNMLEKYLDSELLEDLDQLDKNQGNTDRELHIHNMIDDVLEKILESMNDSIEKLLFLNQFFNCSKEDQLDPFVCHNYQVYSDFEQISQFQQIIQRLELNLLNKLTEILRNSTNLTNNNNTNGINSKSTNLITDSLLSHETMTAFKAISHLKIFEIEISNISSNILKVQCKAIIDLISSKLTLQLQNTKSRAIIKELVIDCFSVLELKKCNTNPERLFMSTSSNELSSCANFWLDFVGDGQREEFIGYLIGARRLMQMDNEWKLNSETDRNSGTTIRGIGRNADSITTNLGIDEGIVSVFVGTWNLGSTKSLINFSNWFKCQGVGHPLSPSLGKYVPHDIYVVALQEVSERCNWDTLFPSTLNTLFNRDFSLVVSKSNSFPKTLNLSVFCRNELINKISNISTDSINTGFANKCGNKGAVSISFMLEEASFCFINCHLSSGGENSKRREEEFRTILNKLQTGPHSTSTSSNSSVIDPFTYHDFLFCTGDFNLRTGLPATEAIRLLQSGRGQRLLMTDEIHRSRSNSSTHSTSSSSNSNRDSSNPFHLFKEPEITHQPTYRYLKGTSSCLDPVKRKMVTADRVNTPSWCDRVLYHGRPTKNESIIPLSYGINLDYKVSDHKPVFSSFLLSLPTRDFSKSDRTKFPISLQFDEILIKLNKVWRSKNNFAVQISGPTLTTGPLISQPPHITIDQTNKHWENGGSWFQDHIGESQLKQIIPLMNFDDNSSAALLFLNPFKSVVNSMDHEISLKPGLSRRDFETNFINFSLLYTETRVEYIGTCVIPLRNFKCNETSTIEINIQDRGISIGSMFILGSVNMACTDLLDISESCPKSRLTDYFTSNYSSHDYYKSSKSILEIFNDIELKNKFQGFQNHSSLVKDEVSAFKPIDCSEVPPNHSYPLTSNENSEWRSLVRNGSGDDTRINGTTRTSMNGFVLSNSMRLSRSKDVHEYKERQNFSDDSSSVKPTVDSINDPQATLINRFHNSTITATSRSHNHQHQHHHHQHQHNHHLHQQQPPPHQSSQDSHEDEDDPCNLMTVVHNENYSTTEAVRGGVGVTNHRRHQDARVDLSSLDDKSCRDEEPPPILPPRHGPTQASRRILDSTTTAAPPPLRPTRTRQQHSNPISIASSSSSSYNPPTTAPVLDSSQSSAVPHLLRTEPRHSSSSSCEVTNNSSLTSSMMTNHDDTETPYNRGTIVAAEPITVAPSTTNNVPPPLHSNNTNHQDDDKSAPGSMLSSAVTLTPGTGANGNSGGHYVQAVHTQNNDVNKPSERCIQPYASMKIENVENKSTIDDNNDIEYVVLQKPINPMEWIESLHLDNVVSSLLRSSSFCVSTDSLLAITDVDLLQLGIHDSALRNKLISSIQLLKNQ